MRLNLTSSFLKVDFFCLDLIFMSPSVLHTGFSDPFLLRCGAILLCSITTFTHQNPHAITAELIIMSLQHKIYIHCIV